MDVIGSGTIFTSSKPNFIFFILNYVFNSYIGDFFNMQLSDINITRSKSNSIG